MEERASWLNAFINSSVVAPMRRGNLVDRIAKKMLPTASAAAAPAPAAPAPAPQEEEMDPMHPIMNQRRALVGKAFSLFVQDTHRVPKFDDLTSEAKGTPFHCH